MSDCKCNKIGVGVQLFRIRNPESSFEIVEELNPDYSKFIGARSIWRCKECGDLFAYLKIPFKDEEEIIVRAKSDDPTTWDWAELVDLAGKVRWRGPELDERWVL
jgi:hypothetical protein